jgi:predicted RNase H-like HicB family nuclease
MVIRYSMVIQWSDEDEVFIVKLPEFKNAQTHGKTYKEAARQGEDLIESFIQWYGEEGRPLRTPRLARSVNAA